jgi:HPt (histidine-containing phosphotransfer) domain-containing protein
MMRNTMMAIGVAALAAAALPGQSAAQAGAPAAPEAPAAPAAAAPAAPVAATPAPPTRLQVVTAKISAVQKRALADPQLQAANRAITTLIGSTALRIDPGYAQYAARANTLKAEVAAAQAAQDNDKLWQLADEAKQLQSKISSAQELARQDAEVQKKLEEYKVQLFNKMVELEPTVQDLVKELQTLQSSGSASGGSL